jgi:AcrR family transcriptional regulator
MGEQVKRKYQSRVRTSAAAATRAEIRGAATRLFVEKGYTATTMREIAETAGVSERTVYAVFPTKVALLNEAIGVAIVGDDLPVPAAERDDFRAALDERDGKKALELFVNGASEVLERAGALMMAGYEAAGTDAELRQAAKAGDQARASDFTVIVNALADHGALRDDVPREQATDILLALASPQVHQMLRHHRGRSVEEYRVVILHALERALLDPGIATYPG